MIDLRFDASDFDRLGKAFMRLPPEIKAKAFARAMPRVRGMVRTRIVKRSSERIDVPVGKIRSRTTAKFDYAESAVEITIRSGWISLAELGARQTRTGVTVRLRGSYKHAFLATMASGHTGVMMRDGKARLPIHELYGPNPAHDVTNNPDAFIPTLVDAIETSVLPRVLHELDRLLPR